MAINFHMVADAASRNSRWSLTIMYRSCCLPILSVLALSACSAGEQFPQPGDYGITSTELGQTRERADIYVDASGPEKLAEFVSKMLYLDACEGEKPTIARGRIAGHMSCPILGRKYETDIMGAYGPRSIELMTSADTGPLGPYVAKRVYHLLEKGPASS